VHIADGLVLRNDNQPIFRQDDQPGAGQQATPAGVRR
jgi:hypothetical protein